MIPITQWLERFGFQGNPFSNFEAGSEHTALLNRYFVEPPYFDEILGDAKDPTTMLIFAPRGGGKTAQRRMVHYYYQQKLMKGTVLSVPYTRFDIILEHFNIQRDIRRIKVSYHIREILAHLALHLLLLFNDKPIHWKIFSSLSPDKRAYLSWLLWHYRKYLSIHQRDILEKRISLESKEPSRSIKDFIRTKSQETPTEHLKNFSDMLNEHCGIDAVYVLVDGVDEFYETAADIYSAVDLIEPLLADLALMEMPHVGFKFFCL